jgi:N6-L-threonylcarbamoyladenine synthase
MYSRSLAHAQGKPWLGINHLEGHALTARLTDKVAFPYLLLLVSGGHTQLLWVAGVGQYHRLGTTLDDAAGECFDKAAKLLGLGYPGGPALEHAAKGGHPGRFVLPIPMFGHKDCNFSFSGLKTAVRHRVAQLAQVTGQDVADLAAATQHAISTSLADRTARALELAIERPTAVVVAGGVAANGEVRRLLAAVAARHGLPLIAPPLNLCGDNAAMIGWAALERLQAGLGRQDNGQPRPRWPLDAAAGSA